MKKRGKNDTGLLEEAIASSPFCRLYVNCFLAELHYFPYFVANNFQERVAVERHFNQSLNLDLARDNGLIANWSIIWHWTDLTSYPRSPSYIYLKVLPGQQIKLLVPRKLLAEVKRCRKDGVRVPPI